MNAAHWQWTAWLLSNCPCDADISHLRTRSFPTWPHYLQPQNKEARGFLCSLSLIASWWVRVGGRRQFTLPPQESLFSPTCTWSLRGEGVGSLCFCRDRRPLSAESFLPMDRNIRIIFSVFENFLFPIALWKAKVLCCC